MANTTTTTTTVISHRRRGRPINTIPLPIEIRTRLSSQYDRLGEAVMVRRLGVSMPTFARCLAGMPVYRATGALVLQALAEMEREEAAETPAPPAASAS